MLPDVRTNPEPTTDDILTLPDKDRVISDLFTVMFPALAVLLTETVAFVPLAELKNTASIAIGADAPPAPPDVADQFAVETLSHVPDPPTQYLFAIFIHPNFSV
jgi:hypothetical protein